MEKYIVIVNQKYLVSVEAGSHGGAEHRCLDLVYGIETAQAFSREDLRTEFFRDAAIVCETLSFAELASKSEAYKAAVEYENECRETARLNEKRIEQLRREIETIEHGLDALQDRISEAVAEKSNIF